MISTIITTYGGEYQLQRPVDSVLCEPPMRLKSSMPAITNSNVEA